MTFKNDLKIKKAQSSVEYIVLFAIIASAALFCVMRAFPMREALVNFFEGACNEMH